MKYYFFKTTLVLFIFLVISCDNSSKKSDNIESAKIYENTDSITLTKLVRQVYDWREREINGNMFAPTTINSSDSLYSGIDWTYHDKLVKLFQESNYFDKTFVDNFHSIALDIDKELKTGKTVWYVGDLPPFGYEADPWCNCQDTPDDYWKKIELTNISFNKNSATFKWTWGDNFFYEAKASSDNGTWRISYLQGFEPKLYR